MVGFAGWSMPVQYGSIVAEHTATRTAAGLFDISHMGRFYFHGEGAAAFLDRLLTRRVFDMQLGKIRYSLMTNEQGGILDDVLVYRLSDGSVAAFHLLVVNAGNRQKIAEWVRLQQPELEGVRFDDRTAATAMFAVQGPRAFELAQPLVSVPLAALDYYTGQVATIGGFNGIVSRTGYTGEDGCELIVGSDAASDVWQYLVEHGRAIGAMPAGLGARDTLRLESAMPLYGHELSEEIDPFQAGLGFAVNLKDREFVGRQALLACKVDTSKPARVGLEITGKRVPREHYPILAKDDNVGEVTSGTFSPTLQRPIAMGYVRRDLSAIGTELEIDVRGTRAAAKVVKLPFYSRST